MDQSSLVIDQFGVGAKFLAEFQKKVPIKAAFWLKEAESDWILYVASDQITDDKFDVACSEILRIAVQLNDPLLDPFHVKLIEGDDGLAKPALDLKRRYPMGVAIHLHDKMFGRQMVEEVYIYPEPISVPAA